MFVIFSAVVLLVVGSAPVTAGPELTDNFPFYHTSEDLIRKAATSRCKGLTVTWESDGTTRLPVARLTPPNRSRESAASTQAMFVFGEHPRELIGPETGLRFLQRLCAPEGAAARQDMSYVLVLDANPQGREVVEGGDYCRRTNEDDVDINRNYGSHWRAKANLTAPESFSSGSAPFSEPETRIIARLINETRPKLFVDVHSGSRSLLMPYLWTADPVLKAADAQPMRGILLEIQRQFCPDCVVGNTADALGYVANGASVDFAYDAGVPLVFLWEIFTTEAVEAVWANRSRRHDLPGKRLSLLAMKKRHSEARSPLSSLAVERWVRELREDVHEDMLSQCFQQFNPTTSEAYEETVERWSQAMLRVCELALATSQARASQK